MCGFNPHNYGINHTEQEPWTSYSDADPFIHPDPRIPATYAWACICRLFIAAFEEKESTAKRPEYTAWDNELDNLHRSLHAIKDNINVEYDHGYVECDACEFAKAIMFLVNLGMVDDYRDHFLQMKGESGTAIKAQIGMELEPLFSIPFLPANNVLAARFLPDEHLSMQDKFEGARTRISWLRRTKEGGDTGGNSATATAVATAISANHNQNNNQIQDNSIFAPKLESSPSVTLNAPPPDIAGFAKQMRGMANDLVDKLTSSPQSQVPPAGTTPIGNTAGFVSSAVLAEKHGIKHGTLKKRLERFRKRYPLGPGWTQVTERGPTDPEYLYQEDAIQGELKP